jgi:diacylglycerol O-acyltransferase
MVVKRLSPLDATFLDVERSGAHMHVGGVLRFEGPAPAYGAVLNAVASRLDLIPRYRQRLRMVPFGLAQPVWTDDARFDIRYHVRHAALPAPGDEAQLKSFAAWVFSRPLARDRPLWEMWLVDGEADGGFSLVSKMHHCLVDGLASINVATVLLDTERNAQHPAPRTRWRAAAPPSTSQVVRAALEHRVSAPLALARDALTLLRDRGASARDARRVGAGLGRFTAAGLRPSPASPYNVPCSADRRITWMRADLAEAKEIKTALGATVNDVVLASVAGALRRHLQRRLGEVPQIELKAMVPVNVRSAQEEGDMGNRISTFYVALPVAVADPVERLRMVSARMRELKQSGQVAGAQLLVDVLSAASPRLMTPLARILAGPRIFNLTVTNIPGPQVPLHLLGRRLLEMVPVVPMSERHALGIAILSYDGRLCFGLLGDYTAMPDLEELAGDLGAAWDELRSLALPAKRARLAATQDAGPRPQEVELVGIHPPRRAANRVESRA